MVEINTDRKKLAKKYKSSEKIIQERQREGIQMARGRQN